ncbi:ribonuclease HII [Candidatus Wolfebacteria bacterium CG10_big_fil_rev_8_21_14_0_10_31_9]|uniref:Ribonuclease n=1 Tax=Candidatus Wolfebacteria bacterium CG10_big_fil_rev_8_21_14_0_10_31_9 TaxID=1975070 RepID=A0A2H0RDW8_9BACT|nr:MAG: ribonuclease HII [Candidatus Wolfebacteria bacterium CG10_big_fil_rev_8_21_14_0_10_31_9]
MRTGYIIGIDEVGRGPLAGPVTVAALLLTNNMRRKVLNSKFKLKDSKKLSQKQREEWVKFIKIHKIPYVICSISPKIIDRINISQSANLAATKTLKKLTLQLTTKQIHKLTFFLDGGLRLQKNLFMDSKFYFLNSRTIIRGDEKIPAISLASIIAKVHRDNYMKKMDKKYPGYYFHKHKGYGTKLHYQMIKKHGISKIHRKSFLKNNAKQIKHRMILH